MFWRLLGIVLKIAWFLITSILWLITWGCFDRIPRYWRRRRKVDYPEDPCISNFNAGVSSW